MVQTLRQWWFESTQEDYLKMAQLVDATGLNPVQLRVRISLLRLPNSEYFYLNWDPVPNPTKLVRFGYDKCHM
jgi:hypothetical protein